MDLTIFAKEREMRGKKVRNLLRTGLVPGILYGPKIKNILVMVGRKNFEKVYQEAKQTKLVNLELEKKDGKKEQFKILIHELQRHPLTKEIIHIDFYQPSLEEKIEVLIPILFKGEAPAVKELNGTLIKNIAEVEIRALPEDLPQEIEVDVSCLKTFNDTITIFDLKSKLKKGLEILKDDKEIVAYVAEPEKVEEELEKPIEIGVEAEKIEKEKKEEKEEEE